jgi:hypothetical protein
MLSMTNVKRRNMVFRSFSSCDGGAVVDGNQYKAEDHKYLDTDIGFSPRSQNGHLLDTDNSLAKNFGH